MKKIELTDKQFRLLRTTLDTLIVLGYRKAIGPNVLNILGQTACTDEEIKDLKNIYNKMKKQ